MATTSLWHIKGRLKDLIDYVENPEKTAAKTPELQDLYNVFSYVQRPEATQEGEYVTAINCLKETALRQDGRLYRLARVSELSDWRGFARNGARNRREGGTGNVGR